MIIETIKLKSKRNPNVFIVNTNCGVFDMHSEVIVKNKITLGEISDDLFYESVHESEKIIAVNLCMKYLSGRMKTEKQIKDYLFQHNYKTEVVNHVLNKLKEYSVVNDKIYAQAYINSNSNFSKNKIKQKLFTAGIKGEVVDEFSTEIDDENSCELNVRKYLKNKILDKSTSEKLIRRLVGMGYSWDTVKKVLNNLKIEVEED